MKTLVVIPAKNEEATIGSVVKDVKSTFDYDVLVVNDASNDRTLEVARNMGAICISHIESTGAWLAIQTGFRFAIKHNYEIVITMDADGQHLASEIPKLVDGYQSENDVVIGKCTTRGSVLIHIAWGIFKKLTGLGVSDITSGFRLYDKPSFGLLSSKEASLLEYQDVGVLLMLRTAGISMREVEVLMEVRENGISRIYSSWFRVVYYMVTTLFICLTKSIPENSQKYKARIKVTDI